MNALVKYLQEQSLILRVPEELNGEFIAWIDNADELDVNIELFDDGCGILGINDGVFRVRLCDLPHHVETFRTFDNSVYYQSGDIHQVLVIEGGEVPSLALYQQEIRSILAVPEHANWTPPEEVKLSFEAHEKGFHGLVINQQLPHGLTAPLRHIVPRSIATQLDPPPEVVNEAELAFSRMEPEQTTYTSHYSLVPKEEALRIRDLIELTNSRKLDSSSAIDFGSYDDDDDDDDGNGHHAGTVDELPITTKAPDLSVFFSDDQPAQKTDNVSTFGANEQILSPPSQVSGGFTSDINSFNFDTIDTTGPGGNLSTKIHGKGLSEAPGAHFGGSSPGMDVGSDMADLNQFGKTHEDFDFNSSFNFNSGFDMGFDTNLPGMGHIGLTGAIPLGGGGTTGLDATMLMGLGTPAEIVDKQIEPQPTIPGDFNALPAPIDDTHGKNIGQGEVNRDSTITAIPTTTISEPIQQPPLAEQIDQVQPVSSADTHDVPVDKPISPRQIELEALIVDAKADLARAETQLANVKNPIQRKAATAAQQAAKTKLEKAEAELKELLG